MLVYEYVNNGNLEQWLQEAVHQYGYPTWEARITGLLGTVNALAYLHETIEPKAVHRESETSTKVDDVAGPILFAKNEDFAQPIHTRETCVIGQYYVWKASTLRKWLEDAEAELEQLRKGKEKGLREGEEQAAMEKARDEALESGVSLTHEELSTKVLEKGKNPKYLRGLGVGPTPTSLSFKSHLESRAHSEVLSIRSEMELLREEQQREREVYQRERERERQEERDRFARLESLVTKFLDTCGTP